jgi:hypothetical protein
MGRGWGDILRHRVQNIFEDAGAVRKGRKESAHEGLCGAGALATQVPMRGAPDENHFHTGGEKRDRCTIFTLLKSKAD